ncbi:MAG TPA: type II CAAX endopeptidase family protein [Bacillales bacterium]|nr:type II CAAX endopeptidase family protein [Bacillales bacterium]
MWILNRIFVNRKDEVRAGWKMASAYMLYLIISILLGTGLRFISPSRAFFSTFDTYIAEIAFILGTLLALKLLDEKRPGEMGLISVRRGYRDLMTGLLLGALSMTAIFVVLYGLDRVTLANRFSHPEWSHFLWTGLLLYILVGLAEEIFFRGYCMTVLQQSGKTWMAVLVSSLLFSLAHSFNPNISILGMVNIFLIGLLFAFMVVKTGNLWMPIGFHIAWNYFQGDIFGFPVSGTAPHGIYNIAGVKGTLWSGGSFGPEGGLLTTILIIIVFLIVWKYPARGIAGSWRLP